MKSKTMKSLVLVGTAIMLTFGMSVSSFAADAGVGELKNSEGIYSIDMDDTALAGAAHISSETYIENGRMITVDVYLLMCDKEAIEVQKILPFLSDTWPLCRIGRAVIRASQSCRQSCNKSQCPACGCRSRRNCTHAPRFSLPFPATGWGSVLQRQGACGQCP